MTRLSIVIVLLIASCCTACSSPTKSEVRPSALHELDRLAAIGTASPGDAWVELPGAFHFSTLGENGSIIGRSVITRTVTDRFDAAFVDAEDKRAETFWRIDEHGNVVMTAHVNHDEHALSLFTPPLVLWHAEMPAGKPLVGQSNIRVVDSRNPQKLKETGKMTRTVTYIGDQRIRTPRGEFIAQRLESRVRADLRLADADERVTRFVVPGVGLVAERLVEDVKILNTLTTTTQRTIVLDE